MMVAFMLHAGAAALAAVPWANAGAARASESNFKHPRDGHPRPADTVRIWARTFLRKDTLVMTAPPPIPPALTGTSHQGSSR